MKGYLVTDEYGGGTKSLLMRSNGVWKNVPPGGILLNGFRSATVFASLAETRLAIDRTITYFHARGREAVRPGQQLDEAFAILRLT